MNTNSWKTMRQIGCSCAFGRVFHGGPIYWIVVRRALVVLRRYGHGREQFQWQSLHRVQQYRQTNVGPTRLSQIRLGRLFGLSASPAGGGVNFTKTGRSRTLIIGGGGKPPMGLRGPFR